MREPESAEPSDPTGDDGPGSEDLERAILGQPPVFNAQEVSERTGVPSHSTRRGFGMWLAYACAIGRSKEPSMPTTTRSATIARMRLVMPATAPGSCTTSGRPHSTAIMPPGNAT